MKFGSKFLFTKIEASKQKILNLFQYFLQRAQAVSPFRYAKIAKKKSLFICNLVANKETLCRF